MTLLRWDIWKAPLSVLAVFSMFAFAMVLGSRCAPARDETPAQACTRHCRGLPVRAVIVQPWRSSPTCVCAESTAPVTVVTED